MLISFSLLESECEAGEDGQIHRARRHTCSQAETEQLNTVASAANGKHMAIIIIVMITRIALRA